ncbi:hypothetical protein HY68_14205 [Streptomyces sp. AcH 505]|nr:hypothetical protein HY68_14205 [Streptomyces sp. AcH 505]
MNSVRVPRWERSAAPAEFLNDPVFPPAPTPIYSALVREWRAAGRTVPAQGEAPENGIRSRLQ